MIDNDRFQLKSARSYHGQEKHAQHLNINFSEHAKPFEIYRYRSPLID